MGKFYPMRAVSIFRAAIRCFNMHLGLPGVGSTFSAPRPGCTARRSGAQGTAPARTFRPLARSSGIPSAPQNGPRRIPIHITLSATAPLCFSPVPARPGHLANVADGDRARAAGGLQHDVDRPDFTVLRVHAGLELRTEGRQDLAIQSSVPRGELPSAFSAFAPTTLPTNAPVLHPLSTLFFLQLRSEITDWRFREVVSPGCCRRHSRPRRSLRAGGPPC